MAVTPDTVGKVAKGRPSLKETLAVYCKRRVLIVLLLGFSSGLPIILIGGTLQAWMTQSGIDVRTIGLFAAVGIPYSIKFLWAPLADALDIPVLSPLLGRRRGWLLFTQIWLIVAIVLLGLCDPMASSLVVAIGALFVATASATQDIIIDAFRVESLEESEQAAGLASYIAAYRIGALVSGAGALLLVSGLRGLEFSERTAWAACYAFMAVLVLIGIAATLLATEPDRSAAAEADHAAQAAQESWLARAFWSAVDSFRDFFSRDLALAVLIFVILFKLSDALAFSLSTNFLLGLGFSLKQLATIRNLFGFVATLLGGFTGGFIARALPLGVEPLDRRHSADDNDSRLCVAGADGHERHDAHGDDMHRIFLGRCRYDDLRRLHLRPMQKPALHGDAICALERARGARAQRIFAYHRLPGARHRLGLVFRHLRVRRLARLGHARLAAKARHFDGLSPAGQ